jgi:hypothetical protein
MLPLLCDSAELADRQAVRCKKEALENVLLCSSKGNVTMRGHKTKPIAQAEELDESALAEKAIPNRESNPGLSRERRIS